ncbi:MAG: HNH endonuclease [Candidatus Altiarchaeales archaeon]|nr:HNH endonuclease [Candidatus Altiarchaeales archaeon]
MGKLNGDTLVLNRSWMAVQICSVKRAISLLYQGHARVVDTEDFRTYNFEDWSEVSQQLVQVDENDFICSPTLSIRIPRVIVLMLYDRLPKRHVRFSRKNIFERDKWQCQYCGIKPSNKKDALSWMKSNVLNLDHVVPRARGGKTTWENVVASCYKCNSKKGSKTLKELGWKLKKEPNKPRWHPTLNIPLKVVPHKEWVSFLDLAYWNTELENDNDNIG